MKVWILAVFALYIAVAAAANFKVSTISLEALTKQSGTIVIAEVYEIVERAGVRVAVANVVEGVKPGSPIGTIEFVAEATWTCDISSAVVGERVLLFLSEVQKESRATMFRQELAEAASESRRAGHTLYEIAHSGRGRLVLTKSSGAWLIAITRWQDGHAWNLNASLMLPAGVKVLVDGPRNGRTAVSDIVASTQKALKTDRANAHS